MDKQLAFLKEITEAPGVPGYEGPVHAILKKHLKGMGKITSDGLGSILCTKEGSAASPRIMLDGHIDECGFMVKTIDDKGFIRFTPLGGWFDQVLLAQRVTILTNKGPILGVIGSKPPHLLEADARSKPIEKKSMFIDIGVADKKEAEKVGVRIGDPIIPVSDFAVMANPKYLLAKAWDDRIGAAIIVEVMKQLQTIAHPNTVIGVGATQEEVGLRGAYTAVELAKPDIGIALESDIAGDTPGICAEESQSKIGKGVSILLYDASMIPHLAFRDFVLDIAKKKKIKHQVNIMERGGTDAGRIHMYRGGVPSIVLGVSARYVHSHVGIIHRDDFDAAVKLVVELVKALDEKTVKGFKH